MKKLILLSLTLSLCFATTHTANLRTQPSPLDQYLQGKKENNNSQSSSTRLVAQTDPEGKFKTELLTALEKDTEEAEQLKKLTHSEHWKLLTLSQQRDIVTTYHTKQKARHDPIINPNIPGSTQTGVGYITCIILGAVLRHIALR